MGKSGQLLSLETTTLPKARSENEHNGTFGSRQARLEQPLEASRKVLNNLWEQAGRPEQPPEVPRTTGNNKQPPGSPSNLN